MLGFEPGPSSAGSDRRTKWATTTNIFHSSLDVAVS